jgi:hypothetical protein
VAPRQYNPEVPSRLERIVMTALSTNPKDRFSGCGTFAKAIEISETDSNSGFIASLPGASAQQNAGTGFVAGGAPGNVMRSGGAFPEASKSAAPVSVSGNVMAAIFTGWLWITFLGQSSETVGSMTLVCAVLTNILFLRILYKAWSALPAGAARTTPGEAVGFLFIPFYNLYWIWRVIPGFAADFNKYAAQSQPVIKPEPETLYKVFAALSYLPLALGIVTAFQSNAVVAGGWLFDFMIVIPAMIGILSNATNRLADAAKQPAIASAAQQVQR